MISNNIINMIATPKLTASSIYLKNITTFINYFYITLVNVKGYFPSQRKIFAPNVCLERLSRNFHILILQRIIYTALLYYNKFRKKPAITKFD